MPGVYKILFEVLLLHEYYLTDADQSSVFDAVSIGDASGYLAKRMQQDRPSVMEQLKIVVPEAGGLLVKNAILRVSFPAGDASAKCPRCKTWVEVPLTYRK